MDFVEFELVVVVISIGKFDKIYFMILIVGEFLLLSYMCSSSGFFFYIEVFFVKVD